MQSILDSVTARTQVFRPESVAEYMDLQLAKKLGDTANLSRYRHLFSHHAAPVIVEALSNVQARSLSGVELIDAFHKELAALTLKEDDNVF